jgi:cation:H+ antiporter
MIDSLSLPAVFLAFFAAALVVAISGTRMTQLADRLADLTGLGEAVTGAVLLGATTSLSGTVVSLTSAAQGNASLAFSNGVGGIAAQTAFLAVADLVWRRANLEHASADIANIFQAALLSLMLALPLLAHVGPEITLFAVHPVSMLFLGLYVFGLRATASIKREPMWRPVNTHQTRQDTPDEDIADSKRALLPVLASFCVLVVVLASAGFVISQTGARIAEDAGISQTAVGSLMTAVSTSLPELVTTVAAVRRGAAQLAVGGIIGGNVFDVLFLTLSDAAYRDGSLYHAISRNDLLWIAVGLLMTAILVLGLVARERRGPGNIGTESVGMLAVYAVAIVIQVLNG